MRAAETLPTYQESLSLSSRDEYVSTTFGAGVGTPEAEMREAAGALLAQLTPREWEVLRLVARGLTNKEIAEQLNLAPKTVGNYVSTIMQKLDVPTRTAAAQVLYSVDNPQEDKHLFDELIDSFNVQLENIRYYRSHGIQERAISQANHLVGQIERILSTAPTEYHVRLYNLLGVLEELTQGVFIRVKVK